MLYVGDHVSAIDLVLHRGEPGEAYNVGAEHEVPNIETTRKILVLTGRDESLIEHVPDRPGHDRRYALDTRKVEALGWEPRRDFGTMLAETIDWYAANEDWWRAIKAGEFAAWYTTNYAARGLHIP
jgi:dTDP-glucose 4,6-dehydratase